MRIPRMKVQVARDLIDLGLNDIFDLEGRSPEILFEDLRKLRPEVPKDRIGFLRMAVYFAEACDPDPKKCHPLEWMD